VVAGPAELESSEVKVLWPLDAAEFALPEDPCDELWPSSVRWAAASRISPTGSTVCTAVITVPG
jgi:hypothetical protein